MTALRNLVPSSKKWLAGRRSAAVQVLAAWSSEGAWRSPVWETAIAEVAPDAAAPAPSICKNPTSKNWSSR